MTCHHNLRHLLTSILTLSIIGCWAASASQAALVAHWTFDNDFNSSVGAFTSAAVGDAMIDTSDKRVGTGALSLDGVGDHVDVSSAGSLNGLTNWTIAGFVKLNSENATFNAIYKTDGFAGGQVHFSVRTDTVPDNALDNSQAAATNLVLQDSGLNSPYTNWVHVAATWDGSVKRLYVDGTEIGSVASGVAGDFGTDAQIGAYVGGGRDWDGLIDDLRIYNSALSASAIQDLSNLGTIPEPSTALLLGIALVGCAVHRQRATCRRSPRTLHAAGSTRYELGTNLPTAALALTTICLVVPAATCQAAIITFGPATTISGDTDVSTNGSAEYAYAWSNLSPTVNGVTFTGTASTLGSGDGNITSDADAQNSGAYASGPAPFTSLSVPYQNILQGANYNSGTDISLSLNNLTPGQNYEVQLWYNDSRAGFDTFTQDVTSVGGNLVTLEKNFQNAAGGVGQFTIGTFKADAISQLISLSSNGAFQAQVNALQLRAVAAIPEPSTALLLGVGLVGLVLRRRRNR